MTQEDLFKRLRILEAVPAWEMADDHRDVVMEGLASKLPEERVMAAGLASQVMDEDVLAAVIELLRSDPSPEVRAQAAISLGPALAEYDEDAVEYFDLDSDGVLDATRFQEVCTLLRSLYSDGEVPTLVRRRCLEAAVRSPQPWHEAAIRAAYQSDDRQWRITAVFCMGYVRGFEREILESLGSDDDRILYQAVAAAGEAYLGKAAPAVEAIASDEQADRELRIAAILAIPKVMGASATELLDELARSTRDREIEEAVEEAAGESLMWAELEALDDDPEPFL